MTDNDLLKEILNRLGGLEEGQRKLEEGQRKLERKVDGQQAWFQTLNQKVDTIEQTLQAVRSELGEMRDLMAHLRDDDLVQKHAIANLSDEVGALKERVG